jgi:hypothetical protein
MTSKTDINFFPWELYFSQNENEINNAIITCTNYPLPTLKFAAQSVLEKAGKTKKDNCEIILKGIQKLVKNVKNELELIELKKDIKQRFFTYLGIQLDKQLDKQMMSPVKSLPSKENDAIDVSISVFQEYLNQGKKPVIKDFLLKVKKDSLNDQEITKIFKTVTEHITSSIKGMNKEEKKKWILSQIKELNPNYKNKEEEKVSIPKTKPPKIVKNASTKIIKTYLDKKGWNTEFDKNNEDLDEYLMNKMLEEEKEFRDNEVKIQNELDRYNLLLSQTQSQITEQNKLVKHLKEDKNVDSIKLKEEQNKLELLKSDSIEIKHKLEQFNTLNKHIDVTRKERKKICHQLNYDEDIIDQAMMEDDLKCNQNEVCNLKSNECEERKEGFSYPVTINNTVIDLIPQEDAKKLEEIIEINTKKQEYTSSPRFVSINTPEEFMDDKSKDIKMGKEKVNEEMDTLNKLTRSRSLSKDEDTGMECFKEKDYETIYDLKEDLDCGEQVCDINTHQCVDKFEEQNINKIDDVEYTYTTNENLDLISKLKQKFKNISLTPTVSNIIQNIQAPVDIDVPVIDMEVPPAHVSEKVNLQSFTNIIQSVQSKPRLSVEQRFNDRTKARRDMIRKCLNLE